VQLVQLLTASASQPVLLATGAALLLLVGLFLSVQIPVPYLVRNLTVRWRTTLMTALAFVLVISLLTVMMAFVNGMYRLTKASGQPGNVMILSDGATDESFSNLAILDIADLENQPPSSASTTSPSAATRPTSSSISLCRTRCPVGQRAASRKSAASTMPRWPVASTA